MLGVGRFVPSVTLATVVNYQTRLLKARTRKNPSEPETTPTRQHFIMGAGASTKADMTDEEKAKRRMDKERPIGDLEEM